MNKDVFKGMGIVIVVCALIGAAYYAGTHHIQPNDALAAPQSPAPMVAMTPTDPSGASLSDDNYKKTVATIWVQLITVTDQYADTVTKQADPTNKTDKHDKLVQIKKFAQQQQGQLAMARQNLDAINPPPGYEAFHNHLRNLVKDARANFDEATNLCGAKGKIRSSSAVTVAVNGANAEAKACQDDARMRPMLTKSFDANILAKAADNIITIHDTSDEPKLAPVEHVTVVYNQPPTMGDASLNLPSIPTSSGYLPAMRSLLNQYLDSRSYVQRWCQAVRRSGNQPAFDEYMQTCINTRRSILSQMQQLTPDPEYRGTHQFCVQIVMQSIAVCQTALNTHNPNDPGFQRFSEFVGQYQKQIASSYNIQL